MCRLSLSRAADEGKGKRTRCIVSLFLTAIVLIPLPASMRHGPESNSVPADLTTRQGVLDKFDSLGGYFIENAGQVNDLVRYYSTGNPSVAFRDDGVMFVVRHVERGDVNERIEERSTLPGFAVRSAPEENRVVQSFAYLLRFEGANPVTPVGRDRLPFNSNFLLGDEPGIWRTDVPNYRKVVYENMYEGIDLVYRQSENGVKYEFVIGPGTDPAAIKFRYEGVESAQLDEGDIVVPTAAGEVRDSAPYSFQEGGQEVRCGFVARGSLVYGFDCEGRDPASRLVIDPLVYSTFLGGADNDLKTCPISLGDYGHAIAVDATGSAYITGVTCSLDFPITAGSFDMEYNENASVFIAKLNPAGSMLLYSTYLGGDGLDWATSIAVDSSGSAYITGATVSAGLKPGSARFPVTPGAFDTTLNVIGSIVFMEAFVTKLNPQGNGLAYSTFLGGDRSEWAWSIAVDSSGNAYVTGETNGTDFPTTPDAVDRIFNSYYGTYDYPDVFVTKFNAAGSALVYSTFVGGEGFEWGSSIQVDAAGNAYVTGTTNSEIFPRTLGAFDRTLSGPLDGFLFRVNAAGSAIGYSTYLGGEGWEMSNSVAVDSSGSAYVTGYSNSTDFPVTPGAFRTIMVGGREAFVTKVNPSGSALVYSTFLGGNSMIDSGLSIALDSLGNAFVTGLTYSADFPITKDAFDTVFSDREGFVSELDASGSSVLYSTFLGGRESDDRGEAVAVDLLGIAYITGFTNSTDFPVTWDAFDRSFNGLRDAFVVKLIPVTKNDPADLAVLPVDITFTPPSPVRIGNTVTIGADVHNIGGTNASDAVVRFFDGAPGPSNQIGTDQVIPFVERFFGLGHAEIAWTAAPTGAHDICVVVDPSATIVEMREDNNQACSTVEVLALQPDLALSAADVSLAPAPPYVSGTTVQVTATIHNIGDAASGGTVVRFHDGVPPAARIGSDQALGPLPAGGAGTASVTWTASPPGNHMICVVTDPDGTVAEMDETNNMACKDAKVLTPTDLAVSSLPVAPPPPLPYGSPAWVNVSIVNWGETAAGPFDVLLFDDANLNSLPDAGEDIAFSPQPDLPGRFVRVVPFTWTAAPGGDRSICAYVDPPPGNVPESNENNNARCSTVTVEWQVITKPDYVPVEPQPPSPIVTAPSSDVDLSVRVMNQGNATGNWNATLAFYNASSPSSPFATASVSAISAGGTSGPFTATWKSPATPGTYFVSVSVDSLDDIAEWDETNNVHTWTIDVISGPVTKPDYVPAQPQPPTPIRVGLSSPVVLSTRVLNQGNATGNADATLAFCDSLSPATPFAAFIVPPLAPSEISPRFTATWTSPATPGTYFVVADVDRDGNITEWDEANNLFTWTVEVVAGPMTSLVIGDPNYTSTFTYVKSSTPLDFSVVEQSGTETRNTMYRIDGGAWTNYTATGQFTLAGRGDGQHAIEWYSEDYAGNRETLSSKALTLDDTPPATGISPATEEVDAGTLFTFDATDSGSGVEYTEFSVDGGGWRTYTGGFNLSEGNHHISYRSVDNLGNAETEKSLNVTVRGPTVQPPPPPSVEANYKPLIALVFAVILAVVGLWSSRRRPWKGGNGKMAVAKVFAITSLPFILAEATTAIVSHVTGSLRIPPSVGIGTAIDVVILLAGLGVALAGNLKTEPSEVQQTKRHE